MHVKDIIIKYKNLFIYIYIYIYNNFKISIFTSYIILKIITDILFCIKIFVDMFSMYP